MPAEVTKRISYNKDTRDYDCYVTIDEHEEYIGSAPNNGAGERKCNDYAIEFYTDNHVPEKAAQLVMANAYAEGNA